MFKRKKLRKISKAQVAFFFYCVLLLSLVYSPFVLSLSMIGLIAVGIFRINHLDNKPKLEIDFRAIRRALRIWKYPSFAVLTLFFLIVLFWFWPLEDADYWMERLRIKLPFLILPFVFLALPRVSTFQLNSLLYFMLLVFVVTSTGIGINYALHFEEYNLLIKQGHHIPTPRNHIRYSLLLALAIAGGYYLWEQKFVLWYRWERGLIGGLTLFLLLFIHLLSVKSGLLVLYVGILVWSCRYLVAGRQLALGLGLLLLLIVIPIAAYYLIPSFKNKIHYTLHDLLMFQQGEGGQYSDSGRLASLTVGWELVRENPLTGVGAGNMRKRVQERYAVRFPDYVEPFMPQNQFLFVWAGTGLIGLLLFLYAFCYPFFYRANYQHVLMLIFYAMIFTAFMIEHAAENAVGVAHYIFFLLCIISHLNREEDESVLETSMSN